MADHVCFRLFLCGSRVLNSFFGKSRVLFANPKIMIFWNFWITCTVIILWHITCAFTWKMQITCAYVINIANHVYFFNFVADHVYHVHVHMLSRALFGIRCPIFDLFRAFSIWKSSNLFKNNFKQAIWMPWMLYVWNMRHFRYFKSGLLCNWSRFWMLNMTM